MPGYAPLTDFMGWIQRDVCKFDDKHAMIYKYK